MVIFEAKELTYRIGKRRIIDKISFNLNHGDFLTIIGPNGAGKSTLLKAIASYSKNQITGDCIYNGVSYKSITSKLLASTRAVCTQKNDLSFAFKVKEVISFGQYGRDKNDTQVIDVLNLFNIDHLANRDINSLSGGEQQKVHIARAIIQLLPEVNGKVLLLDEPMTYLDHKYQKEVMVILADLCAKGLSVVSVLHDVNMASQWSNKILLIKDGQVLNFGPTNAVMTINNLSKLYDAEMNSLTDSNGRLFFR